MSNRALITVIALLIFLGGLAYFLARPDSTSSSIADGVFAPELSEKLNAVETVIVRRAANEVIATLDRDGATWSVRERGGYRADEVIVLNALQALADARIVETKTADPALWYRLGVDNIDKPTASGIALAFSPNTLGLPDVILGDPEGSRYRYARQASSDQSFLINVDPEIPTTTSQWLDAEILNIEGSRVGRIVIRHSDGELVDIFKSSPQESNYQLANIPDGRSLQYPGVANVIGNVLSALEHEDVIGVESSADADRVEASPELVTQFQTFDGLLVTAEAYRVDGESWYRFSAAIDDQFSNPTPEIAAEAAEIKAKVSEWQYQLPSYKSGQLSRRMDDLLSISEGDK